MPEWGGGKGSDRRKLVVPKEQFDENWERAFGKQQEVEDMELKELLEEANSDIERLLAEEEKGCKHEYAIPFGGHMEQCKHCGERP